jgi:hypothetical protein
LDNSGRTTQKIYPDVKTSAFPSLIEFLFGNFSARSATVMNNKMAIFKDEA